MIIENHILIRWCEPLTSTLNGTFLEVRIELSLGRNDVVQG